MHSKINDKFRVFINTILMIATTVIDKILFFLMNILIARYFDINQYGEYTAALGYASFFAVFADIGISQALVRCINLDHKRTSEYLGNALLIKTILSFIVYTSLSLSLFIIYSTTGRFSYNTIILALIFGLVRIGNDFQRTFYSYYEANEKFLVSSFFTIIFSFLFFGGTLLIIFIKGDYFDLAHIRLLVAAVILIIIAVYTSKQLKIIFDISYLKNFIKSTLPFAANIIYSSIIMGSNILIISLIVGTTASGIFNNAYMFFSTLYFIPTNIDRVIVPFLYKADFKEEREKFQFAYDIFNKFLGIISFYITIVFFIYSPDIIRLIFGDKYSASIDSLRILSIGIPLLFSIAPSIITSLDKQIYNSKFLRIAAIVNLFLISLLCYFFGLTGAAWANSITLLILFCLYNGFLFSRNYISLTGILKVYLYLLIISSICFIVRYMIIPDYNWIVSFFIITLTYFICIILSLIKKNDLRIIKEMLNRKS